MTLLTFCRGGGYFMDAKGSRKSGEYSPNIETEDAVITEDWKTGGNRLWLMVTRSPLNSSNGDFNGRATPTSAKEPAADRTQNDVVEEKPRAV